MPAKTRAAEKETPGTELNWISVVYRIYRVVTLFISVILRIGWALLWQRNRPDSPEKDAFFDDLYTRQAVKFRQTAEQLGGLVIKVGQFLSSRVDLLPKPFIDQLQSLQDNVRSAPWIQVRSILEQELGPMHESFLIFDEKPVAAASLGQVYRAALHDGTEVAVKIQRPYIESTVQADLKALSIVVNLLTRFTRFGRTFDLFTVLREFRRMVTQELNYRQELANTELIRKDVVRLGYVIVPKTYPEYSTSRVLTMEFRDGIKVNRHDELRAHNINPTVIAEESIHLYLHMVMESGIFHADPHPGNILVNPDAKLVLLDYGMIGVLDKASRKQIRRLFVAVSKRNPLELQRSMEALGMVRPDGDRAQLRRSIQYLLDRYYAETLDELQSLDIINLLRDFENLLRTQPIQIPGQFAFLGRAIAILVGLATGLDPDINLVELFAPYAKRFVTEDHGGTMGYATRMALDMTHTLIDLPELSSRILRQVENGEIETKVEWKQGQGQLKLIYKALRSLTQSLYVVGFSLIGTLLLFHHFIPVSVAFYVLSLLSLIYGFASRWRHFG